MRKGEACPVPRFSFVKFVAQGSRLRRVARHSGRRCVLETHGSLGTGFEKQKGAEENIRNDTESYGDFVLGMTVQLT